METTQQQFIDLYQVYVLKNQEISPTHAVRMMYMAMQISEERLKVAIQSGQRTLGQCVLEAARVHQGILMNDCPARYAWMELRYKAGEWSRLHDYEKEFYEILTEDHEIVLCWPNAGLWNAVNGDDRSWTVGSVEARLTAEHPMDQEQPRGKRYARPMQQRDGQPSGRMFDCGYCGVLTADDDLSWNANFSSFCCKECNAC